MKKKIGKIVALFIAAGLLINSFSWASANEGDNGEPEIVQESEHIHSFGGETEKELATCGKDGSATVTCSGCGETETRTISATGNHSYGEWTQVRPATKDTAGEEKHVCSQCGAEESREIPVLPSSGDEEEGTANPDEKNQDSENPLEESSAASDETDAGPLEQEHNWTPGEKEEPTCTENGKQIYSCTVDGCTQIKEEELPSAGHKVETWTVELAPAQTTAGSEYGICTVCGQKVTRPIPALGHVHTFNETGTVIKAASGDEDGTVKYFCTSGDCEAFEEGDSHYYQDNGSGEFVCAVCSAKETQGDGCSHDWEDKGDGISECRKCHSIKNPAVKIDPENPAAGNPGDNSPEKCSCLGKCTQDGINPDCAVCSAGGALIEKVCKGALPCNEGEHQCPASYEIITKANCKKEGSKRYRCSVCGTMVTETTPKTAHIWDSKTGKCTSCKTACTHKDGEKTAFNPATGKCAVCGYQCGHEFDEKTGVCGICGFKECENHKRPAGENAVIITVKEATCKDKGLERYLCTVCGKEVTEETEVDPDAHDWNSETGACKLCGETCIHTDGEGNTLYKNDGKCSLCGHTCEHEFEKITQGDEEAIKCKTCGYICTHSEKSLVPMDGKGDKEADCKNAGQQTYLCSVCGEEIVKELLPDGEHQYDNKGVCRICKDDLHAAEDDDCIHKDSRWITWENDGTDPEEGNPWEYVKTDIDAKTDIFRCSQCGSTWERDSADREEKTVDLTQITRENLGITISVNGVEAGDKEEVKINKTDVLDIHINWALDNDRKPTANTTIQYQLPLILKAKPMSDTIWGAGGTVEYGTYSIDADGLLTFRLNNEILKKSEVSGSFDLQATLLLDEETSLDKQEIIFPGGAGIVVYFKSNMTCKKEAKLNNDGSINYKLTFELDSDSKKVSLTDTLGSNLTFEGSEGSFRLKDVSNAAQTDITDKVTINEEKKQAVIDLGDMKKGKYEISYTAKLIDAAANSSNGQNKNTVTFKWDGKEGGPVSCEVKVTGKPLWKNAAATTAEEKAQGIFNWEIVLNKDMIPVDLSGKTIYDWYEISADSVPGDSTYIVGDIKVMDVTDGTDITSGLTITKKTEGSDWNLEDNGLFRIVFPYGDYTHVYKIIYTTQTKAAGMDGSDWGFVSLRNWAKIVETGQNDYEDVVLGKKYGPGILTKAGKALSNDNSGSDGAYKAQWQVKLNLAEFKNPDVLKDLVITDTLPEGMTFYGTDVSEMNFAMSLSDGTPLAETTDYQKQISGNKRTLTLTFSEAGWRKCAGKEVVLTFNSLADSSKIPMGKSKDYKNNVNASFVYNSKWSYAASATVTMYRLDALNKSGEVQKNKNANGKYEILWTILVNTNDAANLIPEKAYQGDITVTDNLPEGLTYVEGSAMITTSTRTDWNVTKSKPTAITPAKEGLPDRLIFAIQGAAYDNAYKIIFKTEVDPASLDKTNEGTIFTNQVVVQNNGADTFAEADVSIAEKDLLKKNGQSTGTHILYNIDVNTNAQMLTSQGFLTLEDEIDSNAEILMNTISVKTVDNATQAETDITDSCTLSNADNKLIIGKIPDGVHVKVSYKAVTVRTGDVTVENSAVLKGEQELASTTISGRFTIKAGASASGRAGIFNLLKLDSSDARKSVEGAEFTLYEFNMDNMDATPAEVGTLITDADGRLTFGEGAMKELEFDVLFCYVETKAPAGYTLDNTPHYFMLEGNSFEARNQQALERVGAGADYRTYSEDGSKTRQLYNDPYTPPTTPPTTPENPDNPGEPDNPTTTVTTTTVTYTPGVTPKVDVLGESKMPDGAVPAAPSMGVLGEMKGPGTGDKAPVIFWALLISTAMAALISCAAFRKKRK